MPVSDTFPYVEGKDGTESEQHVRLKGMEAWQDAVETARGAE